MNVFDLNRWLLYIGKHWNENGKKYLLSLGAIAGLMVLWYSFLILVTGTRPIGDNMQVITYYVGLCLGGCMLASLLFADLSDGPRAIHFLLLPVSAFEKLLGALLYGVVLFFIGYTMLFYVVDFIMIKVAYNLAAAAHHIDRADITANQVINVFVSPAARGDNFYIYFLLVYIGVQSAFLLGSVYFVKFSFIKTTISVLVIFLFLVFFVHIIIGSFLPAGNFNEPFSIYRIYKPGNDLAVLLPDWLSNILLFLFKYSMAPVFWVAAYFRLKEKEV
jgi:hypothetical protein